MKRFFLTMVAMIASMFNGAGAGKPVDAAVGKKRGYAGPASPLNIGGKGNKLKPGAKGNNTPSDARRRIGGTGKTVNKSATRAAGKNANNVMPRSNPASGVGKNARKKNAAKK